MEKERAFLKELDSSANKINLLRYFSSNRNLRNELFKQYTTTEPEPDLSLYFKKYFPEKEWSKAIAENNMNIPLKDSQITAADLMPVTDFDIETDRIIKEFNRLLLEEKLPEKYYRHSIEGTEIYRILTLVSLDIEDFQKSVIDPDDFDFKVFAEAFAIGLINRIEEIHISELTNAVLKNFVSENKNAQIDAVYIVSGILRQNETIPEDEIRSQYRELKRYADNVINEYLKKLNEKDLGKEKIQDSQAKKQVDPKDYDTHWFKSGLLFADGTMDEYWNKPLNGIKEPYSAPDVANEVNLKDSHKYILAVFNNYKTDKNLFNYPHKIKTILDYCEKKNISVSGIFSKKHAEKMNEYK